jgi:hypothetical protein
MTPAVRMTYIGGPTVLLEGVEAARAFQGAAIVPVHYEGWEHFSESRMEIARTFEQAGLGHRLCWLPAGRPIDVDAGVAAEARKE